MNTFLSMNNYTNRVYVDYFKSKAEIHSKIQDAFSWLGNNVVKSGDRVFIKPNLTYPFYKAGVTTSPQFMEAVVRVLVDTTTNITFVESDGGSYAWPAQQAMQGHRIPELCERYGVRMMNLTERPRKTITCRIDGREVSVELSAEMVDEGDLFITMPVPKVHVMTGVSLGFKNQWGCIPDVKRLRHHPNFAHVVLAVNKVLHPRLTIFDGTYFLNQTGPMDGVPVPMNLLLVSNDPGAGSLACCEIMRINPCRVGHLKLAMHVGIMPKSLAEVEVNTDLVQFSNRQFTLERTWLNWMALVAFRSRLATSLLYDSRLAKPIHELLYLIRGRPKDLAPKW